MKRDYIEKLMQEIDFPQEAIEYFGTCMDKIIAADNAESFDSARELFFEKKRDWGNWGDEIAPRLIEVSEKTGVHKYSIEMLYVLDLSYEMKVIFEERGYPYQIFLDTASDYRAKLFECKTVHDTWGTFVGAWYPIFVYGDLIRLGRLEYELCDYEYDYVYEKSGIKLTKGSHVKNIHIPSGEALTEEMCFDSYKKAYDFFADSLVDGKLVCICHSWLLHHSTAEVLPADSNTVRFMHDFDITPESEDKEEFGDKWRVFGAESNLPDSELPEKTSMQRAYKKYLMDGGKTGAALGVLIFDGKNIVNV